MHLFIINGPNLNLLGTREPHLYGNITFEAYLAQLKNAFPDIQLTYFQSNHEGAIIDELQKMSGAVHGIIINAAAYTHTSIAIADTLRAINTPSVEVHISNVYQREAFRHHSFIRPVCQAMICGLGLEGYRLAIEYHLFTQT
jgi:3-dehydroquinate dehydratase II